MLISFCLIKEFVNKIMNMIRFLYLTYFSTIDTLWLVPIITAGVCCFVLSIKSTRRCLCKKKKKIEWDISLKGNNIYNTMANVLFLKLILLYHGCRRSSFLNSCHVSLAELAWLSGSNAKLFQHHVQFNMFFFSMFFIVFHITLLQTCVLFESLVLNTEKRAEQV